MAQLLGFVEYLKNPALVVRAGSDTTEGKRYQRAVTAEIIGPTELILKGYDQGIEPRFVTKIAKILYCEGFRTVHIERIGPPHRVLIATLGPKGALSLKTHLKNIEATVNKDGSPNLTAINAAVPGIFQQFASGQEKLLGMHHVVLHDGSVISSFHHVAADGVGSQK